MGRSDNDTTGIQMTGDRLPNAPTTTAPTTTAPTERDTNGRNVGDFTAEGIYADFEQETDADLLSAHVDHISAELTTIMDLLCFDKAQRQTLVDACTHLEHYGLELGYEAERNG